MRRRAFIAGLGSAAAWPVMARGQQTKVWRVGYLSGAAATDETDVALIDAFRLKLGDLGYVGGKNFRLDVRHAEGDIGRLPVLAAELVALAPDAETARSGGVVFEKKCPDINFIEQHFGDRVVGTKSTRQSLARHPT